MNKNIAIVAGLIVVCLITTGIIYSNNTNSQSSQVQPQTQNSEQVMKDVSATDSVKPVIKNDYSKNVKPSSMTSGTQTPPQANTSGPQGAPVGQTPSSENQPPQSAPQEAITACSGKTVGVSCSFASPMGNETGTCKTVENNTLACAPTNAPAR